MPAALIAIAFGYVVAAWKGFAPTAMELFAAATGWKNWHFLADGRVGDILIIWWSLAIEEQYYLVYPLLVLALMRWGGNRRLLLILGVIAAVSFVVAQYSVATDRAIVSYYGTHGRLWEILVGCLLAIVGRLPRWARVPGWLATGVLIACESALLAHHHSIWAAPTRIVVTIVATLWFIDAVAAREGSRTLRLMSAFPIRHLGLISYEMYLVHSTLLVALPHLGGIRLFTVGGMFLLTVAVAWLLHRVTEPFRVPSASLAQRRVSSPAAPVGNG